MPPFLRSPAAIAGVVVIALAMLVVGFVPLFDGPGYESALLAGLVVPSVVAIVTALEVGAARPEPFDAFCRGAANGGAMVFLAWFVTLIHGIRVGFCDALGGTALFALGPGVGALLAGVWGALAGEIAGSRKDKRWQRRAIAVGVALAGPLISIVLSVSRFYSSPIIFAYDPFFGYFSGTLYDTVVDPSGLITYRAGSAASLFTWFVVALHLAHDDQGRIAFQAIGRPGMLALGALSLAVSIGCIVNGDKLGHWQTPSTISAELGALVEGERCSVVYPRSLPVSDAQRFTRDCDAHVAELERWMEASGTPKVRVYLFKDSAQKASLMGAGDTYIAKPWRREVYVNASSYPHAVIGHELAHVLAGSFGRGPFRVAGSMGGLLPNPGLIEGIAVAASPNEGDLTTREWAKAMKDLGLLPPLQRLFALRFFGENSSSAYTASGAFVAWIKETLGASALRSWYGGRDLAEVAGKPLAELEAAWHADLDRVVLPDAARAQARARFDRPAIFGRRCPHTIDACKQRADKLRGDGDEEGAIAEYHAILKLDPHDAPARLGVALSTLREAKIKESVADLEAIAGDEQLPRHARDKALETLGDVALLSGEEAKAIARYGEVMSRLVDEDQLRTLEVKITAAKDARARPAIIALLIGTPPRGPDRVMASVQLAEWGILAPDDGLPQYLLARQSINSGVFEEAAVRLDRAIERRLSIQRVAIETERLRLIVACGLADGPAAEKAFARYTAHPEVSGARRKWAEALVGRCTGRAPAPSTANRDK
jgi:hypothetical protein